MQVSGRVAEFGQLSGATAAVDSLTQITGRPAAPVIVSICASGVAPAAVQVSLPVADI